MREQRLQAHPRQKFVRTTHSNHGLPTPPNLLDREFTTSAPDRVWAGDVTFLPTSEGWLYLAVLLDLYSRRVVGWAMSECNDEALTFSALTMAFEQRAPEPGLLYHSDRGTTSASGDHVQHEPQGRLLGPRRRSTSSALTTARFPHERQLGER